MNEYTSPQAFSGLRQMVLPVWRPSASLMVVDHVNPTAPQRSRNMPDAGAARQVAYFRENARDFGIELLDVMDPRQGIEHVVAPEQGLTMPGMVVAAGDSHTTTCGALSALGFGIGTSDIEDYLATQTLVYRRLKTLRVTDDGALATGVTAKDLVVEIIRRISADGSTGFAVEFAGQTIDALSIEARTTPCNMIVEAGARGAVISPDEKVLDYIKDLPRMVRGEVRETAREAWKKLASDQDARFDREITMDASHAVPMVT